MKLFLSPENYIETTEPLDISIPVNAVTDSVRAWYLDAPTIEPVRTDAFLGSIQEGGGVNFRNIFFNPHGHGTHTECCGHITEQVFSINQSLKKFLVSALLVTIEPEKIWNNVHNTLDEVITKKQLETLINPLIEVEALIVRLMPNSLKKRHVNYSDTNPPYFEKEVVDLLDEMKVVHFLTDLPSVDREIDGGELAFHHRFWNVPNLPDLTRTITELIFVENAILDGEYVLDLQVAPIENDASPSRPILYQIKTVAN
jgi:kynurenine formamidase